MWDWDTPTFSDWCVETVNNVKVDPPTLTYINVSVKNWMVKGVLIRISGSVKLDVNSEAVKCENVATSHESDHKMWHVGPNFNLVELHTTPEPT